MIKTFHMDIVIWISLRLDVQIVILVKKGITIASASAKYVK